MRRGRRWRAIALLAGGMAIGVVMVGTPAGAHVSNWAHNWKTHIKPKTDARYYKKAQVRNLAGRAAVAQGSAAVPVSFGTIVDVDLRAPKHGFVLVTGTARLDGGTTCPCESRMRLSDGTAASFIYRLHKDAVGDSDTSTISYVFPAAPGLHTYHVQLDQPGFGDLTGASSDATITALFVPYDASGGTSPFAEQAAAVQTDG